MLEPLGRKIIGRAAEIDGHDIAMGIAQRHGDGIDVAMESPIDRQ
ncbi:MAG: hypothetical protein AB7E55_01385 [Pigmentiphaga sp.]